MVHLLEKISLSMWTIHHVVPIFGKIAFRTRCCRDFFFFVATALSFEGKAALVNSFGASSPGKLN